MSPNCLPHQVRHARTMRAQHASIVDALSGKRLDVKEHCVPIEIAGANLLAEGEQPGTGLSPTKSPTKAPTKAGAVAGTVADVASAFERDTAPDEDDYLKITSVESLCRWLHTMHARRVRRSQPPPLASCVLLTAGPAAGKTCLLSQLVVHSLDLDGAEVLPVLIKVQDLQKLLLSKEPSVGVACLQLIGRCMLIACLIACLQLIATDCMSATDWAHGVDSEWALITM